MKTVGFTGTGRQPLTQRQKEYLASTLRLLYRQGYRKLRHGDCIHADATAHEIATRIGYEITIHPPEDSKARAFCEGAAEVLIPRPYLERNHDIVDGSSILIACPRTAQEEQRSGTWATVRYAREQDLRVILIGGDR